MGCREIADFRLPIDDWFGALSNLGNKVECLNPKWDDTEVF